MPTLNLNRSEMELVGIEVEDREIRQLYSCACLITEYIRVIDGKDTKKWFSDGGCRELPIELTKTQATVIASARLNEAAKTIKYYEDRKAAGEWFGARASRPLYAAQAKQNAALKLLSNIHA